MRTRRESPGALCAIVGGSAKGVGAPPKFRTIQVFPKDLWTLLRVG
jgi:hypothetical protein